MKKKLLLGLLSLALSLPTQAIRPKPVAWTMTQRDGTTIKVYAHGDGHVAFFTSMDGKILVKDNADNFYYAVMQNGELVASPYLAHEAAERSSDEMKFLASNDVSKRVGELKALLPKHSHKAPHHKAIVASTEDGLGKFNKTGAGAVNSLGEKTIPVIMVEFSDTKFKSTTTIEKMNRYYNKEGYNEETHCVGSVRDYFISQSRGMFKPSFDVVAKVTLEKSYKDYGANDYRGNDKDIEGLVADAVAAAKAEGVDFSKYENAEGKIELVSVLYAGRGEATEQPNAANKNLIWPCEMDIDKDMSGHHFNSCFVGNELDSGGGSLMGMGIFCHEFGHALGLPDWYCTDYSYTISDDPFSYWSIMDAGAYIQDGRAPIGYTAYERSYLGWLDIKEITDAQTVKLDPATNEKGNLAVLVRNPKNKNEYFILENRYPGTWYPEVDSEGHRLGSGLMVSHFTYDRNYWSMNVLNNTRTAKRAYIVSANNQRLSYSAYEANLYGNGVNDIQAFTLFNKSKLETPVYKITKNEDGTITFNFIEEDGVANPYKTGDVVEVDGLTYKYLDNKEWTVTAKENGKYEGNVNVPETFVKDGKTYTVVAVADSAFANCPELANVSLPASVREIAASAFRGSSKVQSVKVDAANAVYQTISSALFTKSPAYEYGNTSEIASTATFDFAKNPNNWPASTNSDMSAGNVSTLTQDGITMTAEGGSTATRIWNSYGNISLRVYKGGTLTFSVPANCKITGIEFVSDKLYLEATEGLSDNKWTGNAQSVKFAFKSSSQISEIKITVSGLTSSEAALLYYPASLTGSYNVPNVVTRVGDYAFEGTSLSSVVLPASLMKLGDKSLSSASLTNICVQNEKPATATADPFTATSETDCKIGVWNANATVIDAYKAAQYWNKFFITDGIGNVNVDVKPTDNQYYDLQGRRVENPTRGIYIQNGKKVIIK